MVERKTATEARQAETRRTPRRVLVISTSLAFVALGAILLWFFAYR